MPTASTSASTQSTVKASDSVELAEATSPADLRAKLAAARGDLAASLKRKRAIDKNLINIEHTIYQFESSYLSPPQDGAPVGNVVKGYENYLKALTSTNLGPYDRKRMRLGSDVREEERLFSRSSETYVRSLELKDRDLSATSDEDRGDSAHKKRKR